MERSDFFYIYFFFDDFAIFFQKLLFVEHCSLLKRVKLNFLKNIKPDLIIVNPPLNARFLSADFLFTIKEDLTILSPFIRRTL